MTSVHPVDVMPIDETVAHQLRNLEEPNVKLQTMVYDNKPPSSVEDSAGLPARLRFKGMGAQDYALQELARKNFTDLHIKQLDYSKALTDVHFLDSDF